MKVAFVVNTFPPRMGGLEQHLGALSSGLSKLGHSVVVVTIANRPGVRSDGEVAVLSGQARFPIADVISFPNVGTTNRVARFLDEQRVDVVSTHTRFFPMSLVGVRAAGRSGIPVVHTEHGSGFVASDDPAVFVGSRAVDMTMGRYVLRHADRVLGVSEEAASFAARLGCRSTDVFFNAIPEVSGRGPAEDRPSHLVFVGRLVPGKGWDVFLRVVAAVRALGFDVDAEVLGDGPDRCKAEQMVSALGLAGVVRVLGRVSPEEVRRSLSGATLVNPTTLSEGFQTTLLEALAERGRVVTYEVPGAFLLQGQGFPVVTAKKRDTESMVEAVVLLLSDPPALLAPRAMQRWMWPQRVLEYEAILKDVVAV